MRRERGLIKRLRRGKAAVEFELQTTVKIDPWCVAIQFTRVFR